MSLFTMTTVPEIKNKIDLFSVGGLPSASLTLFLYKFLFTKLTLTNQSAVERLNLLRKEGLVVRWVEYLDPTPKEPTRLAWCMEAVIKDAGDRPQRVIIASKCNEIHFRGLSIPEDEVCKGINEKSDLEKYEEKPLEEAVED